MADLSAAIDQMFDKIDADHSGSISKSEMDIAFKLFDTDGSGAISESEWVKECSAQFHASEGQAKSAFAKIHKNGSNEISSTSFQQLFSDMDSDGNGSISKDEFRVFWSQLLS